MWRRVPLIQIEESLWRDSIISKQLHELEFIRYMSIKTKNTSRTSIASLELK